MPISAILIFKNSKRNYSVAEIKCPIKNKIVLQKFFKPELETIKIIVSHSLRFAVICKFSVEKS